METEFYSGDGGERKRRGGRGQAFPESTSISRRSRARARLETDKVIYLSELVLGCQGTYKCSVFTLFPEFPAK